MGVNGEFTIVWIWGLEEWTIMLSKGIPTHIITDFALISSEKLLYRRRLEQNLMHSPCSLNIDVEWQNTLQQAANEALGKRKKEKA